MVFDCTWDLSVKLWTIGIGALLLFAFVVICKKAYLYAKQKSYLKTSLYGVLFGFIVCMTADTIISIPENVELTKEAFVINSLFTETKIGYSSIEQIRRVKTSDLKGECRSWGSSGFGGDQGEWKSTELGKYEKFSTNSENQIWLEITDKNNIMFSCDNPDQLIELVKAKLK